jgi:hypothetical protein
MNIFFLHRIARLAAKYHCNKHVVKMILETAQLLSSAHHQLDPERGTQLAKAKTIYKPSHANHPCAIWTRETSENYKWLCQLGQELCKEYTARYGKVHKTDPMIKWFSRNLPSSIPKGKYSDPPQVMPEEHKQKDTVTAYRTYYVTDKARFAKWPDGKTPKWYTDMLEAKRQKNSRRKVKGEPKRGVAKRTRN